MAGSAGATDFTLSAACPPSFDLGGDGYCRLVSLYQLYTAAPGQGGLRVPLPELPGRFTPRQIDLGRLLFFDPLLSDDRSLSCAHCHHPDFGLGDSRPVGMGAGGSGIGPARSGGARLLRNTPTLWNVGFLGRLFWDGRAKSLEEQASSPLFAPDEMGNTPERLLGTLAANPAYRRLFASAFERDEEAPITLVEITTALAAFESTLVSLNSRFDRYAHGDETALSEPELRGWNVFRSFVGRCAQCHVPPLFASDDLAVVGAPPVAGQPYDRGAGAVAPVDPVQDGAFKVPTLRNVALTAPYFQAGQFDSLREVVEFYNAPRGHAVPAGTTLQIHWHVHMQDAELSPGDVDDLLAFLNTLTDVSMTPRIPERVPSGLAVVPQRHQ